MLTYNKRTTVELDDGAVIEIRPASLSIGQKLAAEADSWTATLDMLEACVVSWSYEETLSREMLGELDPASAGKVINAINAFSGTDTKNS